MPPPEDARTPRPAPGEELNPGAETPARASASVIVLRDTPEGPEVLLVRRNPDARFMGGAWVFPGGAESPEDGDLARTGVRELAEEAAVQLGDAEELVPFSRWITPAEVTVRFDTRFFLARAPVGAEPVPDGSECVAARWWRPVDALDAHARGELELVFPTIKHLEELAGFPSVAHGLDAARARDVTPVQPRVVAGDDGDARVLLPGEPGYAS